MKNYIFKEHTSKSIHKRKLCYNAAELASLAFGNRNTVSIISVHLCQSVHIPFQIILYAVSA